MYEMRVKILFNSISVISGRLANDNLILFIISKENDSCETVARCHFSIGTPLTVGKLSPRAKHEPETARSVGQRLTHWATGAPGNKAVHVINVVI